VGCDCGCVEPANRTIEAQLRLANPVFVRTRCRMWHGQTHIDRACLTRDLCHVGMRPVHTYKKFKWSRRRNGRYTPGPLAGARKIVHTYREFESDSCCRNPAAVMRTCQREGVHTAALCRVSCRRFQQRNCRRRTQRPSQAKPDILSHTCATNTTGPHVQLTRQNGPRPCSWHGGGEGSHPHPCGWRERQKTRFPSALPPQPASRPIRRAAPRRAGWPVS